jgi:hypothetical protein
MMEGERPVPDLRFAASGMTRLEIALYAVDVVILASEVILEAQC